MSALKLGCAFATTFECQNLRDNINTIVEVEKGWLFSNVKVRIKDLGISGWLDTEVRDSGSGWVLFADGHVTKSIHRSNNKRRIVDTDKTVYRVKLPPCECKDTEKYFNYKTVIDDSFQIKELAGKSCCYSGKKLKEGQTVRSEASCVEVN